MDLKKIGKSLFTLNKLKKDTLSRSDIEASLFKEFPQISKTKITDALDVILNSIIDTVALDDKVDAVVSFYQSGGMNVTGNLNSLKNMPVQMMAMKMLKKAGIVTIGICSSKITGGTFCNVYGNDFIFAETLKNENLLFAGKRVSASVNKGQELPEDFGRASSLVDHGMIDGAFDSRMEIREKITSLIRVVLKKPEIEARIEEKSNVTVDASIKTSA